MYINCKISKTFIYLEEKNSENEFKENELNPLFFPCGEPIALPEFC